MAKKIINGKKYDTDTADFMGMYQNTPYLNNFNYYREELYRKRTGEFFLFGEGNANSPYKETVSQNEWSSGWRIRPLTDMEAREWAESRLDADEYELIFGETSEENDNVTVSLDLSAETVKRIMREAEESGQSFSEYVENALKGSVTRE